VAPHNGDRGTEHLSDRQWPERDQARLLPGTSGAGSAVLLWAGKLRQAHPSMVARGAKVAVPIE
jgi:hypothetical protein